MTQAVDLTGLRFGHLIAVERKASSRAKKATWICRCDCNREVVVVGSSLTNGNTKSCGCSRFPAGEAHPGWAGHGEISGRYWANITRRLRGAHRRIIPVTISVEYAWGLFLEQDRKCALSGLPLRMAISQSDRHATASLDRIDSALGYEEGNVQWVHKDINRMKSTFSQEHFIDLCRKVTTAQELACVAGLCEI